MDTCKTSTAEEYTSPEYQFWIHNSRPYQRNNFIKLLATIRQQPQDFKSLKQEGALVKAFDEVVLYVAATFYDSDFERNAIQISDYLTRYGVGPRSFSESYARIRSKHLAN